MAKSRSEKERIVKGLEESLKKAKIILFTSFGQHSKKGLSVKAIEDFKTKLRSAEAEFSVVKKTLIKKAFDNFSFKGVENIEKAEGSLGVVFGYDDILLPAKEVYSLFKESGNLVIDFGLMLDGGVQNLLSPEEVVHLAKLPPRETLLAQLAGGLKAPIYLFKNVLEANLRNLVLVLGNIKK